MMTKKHFNAMAKIIANSHLSREGKRALARDFVQWLKTESPAFDSSRFYEAAVPSIELELEAPSTLPENNAA